MEQSWSELESHRRAVRARWPSIWRLPVTARSTRFAAARIRPGERVLDVGASEGGFGQKLPSGAEYRTLDVDPRLAPDHRSLDEVPASSCDVVVCFETLEHLEYARAAALAAGMRRVLRPGGRLFLSTPNVHHPWFYLGSATHRTPFRYDELGALLLHAGFQIDGIYRCHKDAWLKAAARWLARPIYCIVGVDYSKSILAHAHRPAESTSPEK